MHISQLLTDYSLLSMALVSLTVVTLVKLYRAPRVLLRRVELLLTLSFLWLLWLHQVTLAYDQAILASKLKVVPVSRFYLVIK